MDCGVSMFAKWTPWKWDSKFASPSSCLAMTGIASSVLEYLYRRYKTVVDSDVILKRKDLWIAHILVHITPTNEQFPFYGFSRQDFYMQFGGRFRVQEYARRLSEVYLEDRL